MQSKYPSHSRPTADSPDVRKRAAQLICARLIPNDCGADAVNQLTRALRARAQERVAMLEAMDWFVDARLREAVLHPADDLKSAHLQLVAEWVKERKIRPLRQVGQQVPALMDDGREILVTILSVDASHACYEVAPAYSQVPVIVPFECLHDLVPAAEQFELEMCA